MTETTAEGIAALFGSVFFAELFEVFIDQFLNARSDFSVRQRGLITKLLYQYGLDLLLQLVSQTPQVEAVVKFDVAFLFQLSKARFHAGKKGVGPPFGLLSVPSLRPFLVLLAARVFLPLLNRRFEWG